LRPLCGASGIEVVCAATMPPVSSKQHKSSVIAARVTALCHSNGTASERTQSRQ
jgi:hypothetical protein